MFTPAGDAQQEQQSRPHDGRNHTPSDLETESVAFSYFGVLLQSVALQKSAIPKLSKERLDQLIPMSAEEKKVRCHVSLHGIKPYKSYQHTVACEPRPEIKARN